MSQARFFYHLGGLIPATFLKGHSLVASWQDPKNVLLRKFNNLIHLMGMNTLVARSFKEALKNLFHPSGTDPSFCRS